MKPTIPKTAKKVFEGVTFSIWQWEQEQFDGSYKTFEVASRRDSATIVLVVNGKIIINEEEQPGHEPFISLPGGEFDLSESDPLLAAQRELREETGYIGGEWELWRETWIGYRIVNTHYIYIVREANNAGQQKLDSGGEKIIVRELSFDEFIALKDEPKFRNRDFLSILEKASTNKEFKEEIRKKLFGTV